jgi:hypothetical protein
VMQNGIGEALFTKLRDAGLSTASAIHAASAQQLDAAAGRRPPFGKLLKDETEVLA